MFERVHPKHSRQGSLTGGGLTPEIQALWSKLATIGPVCETFVLAGDTALAVHFGHRKSYDLGFFSTEKFNPEALEEALASLAAVTVAREEGTLHSRIQSSWSTRPVIAIR